MKTAENVRLIEYSPGVDLLNTLTHALGAALAAAGLVMLCAKAYPLGAKAFFSCLVYAISLLAVYTASTVYHALPQGERRRRARVLDHLAIPLLLAGTTTPCALISLGRISAVHSYCVFAAAWICAITGISAKIFSFEKMRAVVMVIYFTGGAAMLISAFPVAGRLNKSGFSLLVAGCVLYSVGALFCRWGMKKPYMHVIFHIFTMLGSACHFASIYGYVI